MIKLDIPCVILSGGKSSRMGKDKSLLPFDTASSLIQYQYNKLSKIFNKVYISSKIDKFDFQCDIIYDNKYDNQEDISSPMVALHSIFTKLKDTKVFIITVDTPLILESTIKKLIDNGDNYDITIASDKEKVHNLCGVFSNNLLETINKYIEEDMHKINFLIKNTNKSNIVLFENEKQFININTKEQYDIALEYQMLKSILPL